MGWGQRQRKEGFRASISTLRAKDEGKGLRHSQGHQGRCCEEGMDRKCHDQGYVGGSFERARRLGKRLELHSDILLC